MHSTHDSNAQQVNSPTANAEFLHGLLRIWRLMLRRQRVIFTVLASHVVLGVVYFALAPREYQSDSKLMIIQQSPDQVSTLNEQSGSDTIMSTHRELVRSPVVVGAAIEKLAPEHRIDLAPEPPSDWVDTIAERLSASTVRKTNVLQVSYRSADPEAAAAVVTAVTDAYLDFVEKTHGDTAAEVLAKLTAERDLKRRELAERQQELQQLRQTIGHLSVESRDGVVDPTIARAIQLNESLVEIQKQRLETQASLATVEAALSRGEDVRPYLALVEETVGREALLSTLGMSEQDQSALGQQQMRLLTLQNRLRRISAHLGPRHPEVLAVQDEIGGIERYLTSYHSASGSRYGVLASEDIGRLLRQMLRQSIAQAWQREQQLTTAFEAARGEAAYHSGALIDLAMRERDVTRLEREVDVLFEKIAAIDIHQVQGPIKVTPVEQPLPDDTPVSPRFELVFAASIVLGLLVGVGIVYAQDLLDDRFGSPEEIALQLDTPVLALVRKIEAFDGPGLESVAMHRAGSTHEMEAFRTLRTAITLGEQSADRIAISSAEPSDGKTTVSSNLAVAFAQIGRRTLVIDADLRRPGMTTLLDQKGRPGVTDVLVESGDVARVAERVVQRTAEPKLDIIPAGPRRANAPELLSGQNFSELLAWADANYDQVLIDCPPVLAVSDAQLVGRLVDGVLLVISPDKNHRRLVARACDSFHSAGVHLLGVVANRVGDAGGAYGYGYGYGYGADPETSAEADPKNIGEPRLAA
ncbi:MAG: polysaccharide biosynthesis tyrosine autokinase [Bacteroidota bacterium]